MSNRSSLASRNLGAVDTLLGGANSLENINTTLLDDGCFCYVTAEHLHYELHRDDTAAPILPAIVAPIAGPGRWVPATTGSGSQSFANSFELASAAFGTTATPSTSVWHAMPEPGAGTYQAGTVGSFWTINTTTGVMTYSGPSGLLFMVMMTCSVSDDAGVEQQLQFDITVGGSLIGTSTATTSSVQGTMLATTVSATEFVHNVILSPNNGATIQHAFRCVSATPGNMAFLRYQVQIIKL